MRIEPDHTKVCYGVVYARELRNEYLQSAAEGKDIEKYEALFTAIDSMPLNKHKVKMADTLFELVLEAPIGEGDNGMMLYHGSYLAVVKPDIAHSRVNVDFGRGFYTTPLLEQVRPI